MVRYGLIALFGILALVGGVMIYIGNYFLGGILSLVAGLGIAFVVFIFKGKQKAISMEQYLDDEIQTREARLPNEGPYAQVTYDPTAEGGIRDYTVGHTEPGNAKTEFRPAQMLQEAGRDLALAHKNKLVNDMIEQITQNIADPGLRQQAIADAMKYLGAQPEVKASTITPEPIRRRERRKRTRTRGSENDPFDIGGGTFFRRKRRYD